MEAKQSKVCGRGECSHAKVSFFGPFMGYNVIAIDKEYKYVLVAGGALTIYGYCLVKSQFR
jgi:apolipoprotein D and lipocalin family protein